MGKNNPRNEMWSMYMISKNPTITAQIIKDHFKTCLYRDNDVFDYYRTFKFGTEYEKTHMYPGCTGSDDFLRYMYDKDPALQQRLWQALRKYPDDACWPFEYFSCLKPPADILIKHKDKEWDWENIINVPWEIIKDFDKKNRSAWDNFSLTGKITLGNVLENPQLPWNILNVYCNMNIPYHDFMLEYIYTNKEDAWEDFTEYEIQAYGLQAAFVFSLFCAKKDLPLSVIKENQEKYPWPVSIILKNHGIDKVIREYGIQCCPLGLVTYAFEFEDPWSIIKDNLDLEYDLELIVQSYEKKLFDLPKDEIYKTMPQFYAARTIQRAFRKANVDPEHLLCQRRLLREFKSLSA